MNSHFSVGTFLARTTRLISALLILLLIAGAQSAAGASLVSPPSIIQATGTAPSGLASPSQELTSIKLTWNAWNNAPRYRIQFSTKPDMSGATYYRYGTTSATITGLTKDTTYYFRVRALDSDNSTALSPYSASIKVSTKTDSPAPTGLKSTEQSEFGIKLAWNAWNNAPRYRIQFSTKADMSGPTYYRYYTTTADIRGLTPNTTYYFRVAAISADGTTSLSPYSSAITAKTTAAAPTATPAPTGLNATEQSEFGIKLAWNAWNNAPRYRIQFSTKADMSGPTYYRYYTTTADIRGLTPNTTYYFRVAAISADGTTSLSPYSSAVTAKTTAAAPTATPAPTGLNATEQSEFGIKLAWNAWNDAPRYRIQFSTKADMSGPTYYRYYTTTADIRGLTPDTTYYFRVAAISADGTTSLSPYSSAVTAKTTAAAPTATPAPTGLNATEQSEFGIKLAWNAWNDAPRYRIQFSTKADMSGPTYYRYYTTTADIRGLTPDTTYYFRVAAISADGTTSLSPYSSAVTAKTTAAAPTATPAPTGLSATALHETAVELAWNAWNNAPRYRIQFSTKADMSEAIYNRYDTTTADIRGLTPDTTYYFRVAAISADGTTSLSPYSNAIAVRTSAIPVRPAVTNPLTVASYNVACASCFSSRPDELPWSDRRASVVSTIKSRLPDVIGVQEASQGWLTDDPRPGGVSQFEDLKERLVLAGAPYELTNNKRNNCVKDTTPTGCVYADQGASQGTKLYYNTATIDLVSQGSKELPAINAADNKRFFAWGIFSQKSTGKRFFVGNTHLEPSSGEAYYELRKKQTEAIIAEIKIKNADGLPVLITGDMNSNKWTAPSNAPYDLLTDAGYSDPLGNTYATDLPSGYATAEKTVGAFYDSFNGYLRRASARHDYGNGTYLDYIFTSKMRIGKWETVVNVDGAGNFVGVIPSDHNMITAQVQLP